MPRTRRSALAAGIVAASALLAGCVADSTGSPQNDSTDTSDPGSDDGPTGSTTSGQRTALPDTKVPFPDGPKERPELPETLTESSVRQFVKNHEYNYEYNELWENERTEVELSCTVHTVEAVDIGWKAIVSSFASANYGGGTITNSTRTKTVVHADYFTRWFTYFVDDDSVVRREATDEERERAK